MKKNIGSLVGFLALLLCVGVSGWLFLQNRTQGARSVVLIQSPASGALTEVNQTLPLMVYAEANRPILRLEVYADGALAAAANGNEKALTLAQPWAVTTPGRHVLLARAFFSAKDFADSQAVFVDTADLSGLPVQVNVDDLPRGEGVTEIRMGDLAAAAGIPPAELARLNPGLPAAPEAVIPPGTPLSLPRRSSPPPAPGAIPAAPPPAPGAPGMHPEVPPSSIFEGETHTCSAISLRWTDAPDETAYILYRLAPGEALNTEIARLPANQTTYTDSDIPRPGVYHYMLAPQRPSGGSITSLHSVEIGPECAPAPAGTTSLQLVLLRLRLEKSFDGIYCYASVNGSRYERIPAGDDLLRPSAADWSLYQLPMQLPSRGAYSLSVPSDGTVDFALECWGRRGALSESLGEYIASHPSADWDGRTLSGRSAATALNPNTPRSYLFTLEYRIARPLSALDITRIYEGALEPQYVNIPPILDSLSAARSDIPSPVNVALQWGFGCDPLLYLYSEGGYRCALYTPQIGWMWFPSATVTRAMLTGFTVQIEFSEPGNPARRAPGPQFRVDNRADSLPLQPLPIPYRCGTTAYITVTAHTAQGSSAPSTPLVLRLPDCKEQKVRVRITSIQIGPANPFGQLRDDGDICILCDDRRLEVFGAVYVNGGRGQDLESLGHGAEVILFGACPATTICLTAGTYPFEQYANRIPWLFELDVPQTRNGAVFLTVSLQDYDTENSPDMLCHGNAEVRLGPLVDKNFRQTLTVASNFGEAACRINAEVTLAP
jgi:hypothetical protein